MYIYHALINALSAHMIHINGLNNYDILYTRRAQSHQNNPHKAPYGKTNNSPPKKKQKKQLLQMCVRHWSVSNNAYMRARTHTTHNDCSRNWILILVRMEILWEEEGFQLGFKRWQGWAVSKVLEWISNVGSKAREGEKAMSLAFVLLDFQHAGVRRRV